jgi:serine/threonine-protein kinase HipA
MPTPSKSALIVWTNGQRVGTWDQRGQTSTFTYERAWVESSLGRPLSLSLPLLPDSGVHRGAAVEAFFENLLPDNQAIRRRIRQRVGARSTTAFDLLTEIGRDCAGAVQIVPIGFDPGPVNRIDADVLDETTIAEMLRSVTVSGGLNQRASGDFRISIAGAQEKTAFLRHEGNWCRPKGATPTTHIFKLPLGKVGNMQADLSTSVENEWLCREIVAAFGLEIAPAEIATFEDQKVLVVERFDRKLSNDGTWWIRIPQEDMCQVFGLSPDQKYESDGGPGVVEIMDLLSRSTEADADRRAFFKAQLVFWLLAAPDGHAKNFSIFLNAGGTYQSTPLYDVMSAYPVIGRGNNQIDPYKVKLAMAVVSKSKHYRMRRLLPRQWEAMAKDCGVDGRQILEEVATEFPRVVESVSRQIPAEFPDSVASPILDGLTQAGTRLLGQLQAVERADA